ncbi:MAG: InlB B-repeat-containing protein, partial [Firmicutes bacterium]|nr:InlB B-repeat-containing protein [Bacillota bacterium]
NTFAGWFENEDLSGTAVTSIPADATGNKTFYAKWGGTITLDPGDGELDESVPATITADNGEEITLPDADDVTNEGHTLIGWDDGDDTTEPYAPDADYTVDGNETLTAVWGGTITLDPGDGELPAGTSSPIVEKDGTEMSLPTLDPQDGPPFLGWKSAKDGKIYGPNDTYTVDGDDALTAVWGAEITFDPVEGTLDNSVDNPTVAPIGEDLTLPGDDDVTNEGYTLIGWDDGEKTYDPGASYPVSDDATLTAVWGGTVTYDANGGKVSPASETKANGETVTLPTPTRSGYTFQGWKDKDGNTYQAGDTYTVDGDDTLTAQWKKKPSSGGSHGDDNEPEVIVTVLDPDTGGSGKGTLNDDGSATIKVFDNNGNLVGDLPGGVLVEMPASEDGNVVVIIDPTSGRIIDLVEKSLVENGKAYTLLDGSATIKIIDNAKPFDDVKPNDWFNDAVVFVSSHELFNGIGNGLFAPYDEMTRGMLVTVLWRLEDRPEADSPSGFPDVLDGAYYAEAVAWAAENGIAKGYGDGLFRPDQVVSREEMAAFLHRYMDYLGYDTSARASLNRFSDGDQVSAWAVEDVKWAVADGIIAGRTNGTLDPQGTATRAEVATMLKNIVTDMVK